MSILKIFSVSDTNKYDLNMLLFLQMTQKTQNFCYNHRKKINKCNLNMLWFYKWHRKLIKHLFPIDSNLISSYKSISKVHLKKNISLSTSSGSRQDRVAVTISPAQLNTLLLGIDVPGIPRNACATIEIFGNLSRWLFHHCNGSAFKAILNLDLYLSTSSWNQKYSFLELRWQ